MAEFINSLPITPPRRQLPSAIGHVLSNWGGFFCSTIVALFLSPFVVHHLGDSAYGLWILIASLTGYLGLLNLGVGSAMLRYVARFHAEANDSEASAIVSAALAIFLVAGTVAIALSLILPLLVVRLFHITKGDVFTVWIIIILCCVTVAVTLLSDVFSGTVTALHRFDLYNIIGVGHRLFSATTIVLVLTHGNGLISLALVNLSFAVAAGLAYAGVTFRIYPALKIHLSKCDWQHLKLIFSFSAYAFLLQLSFNMIFYADSTIIGLFLPVRLITFFAIGGNLMVYSRGLIGGISALMTPRASALSAGGNDGELQTLLLKSTRLATIVILPIAVTFLLRGNSFIRLWMGQEYGELSGRVLWILTLALIFIAADQVATSTMLGIGKHRLVVIVVCVEALCNLALSIALVRPMGILGVAWGTTLPSLAVSLLFWPWYVNHALRIPVHEYIISTWVRPTAAVLPFGLLSYGMEKLWPASNLFTFFLQIAAIFPTVVVASWYLCFDRSERTTYAQRFVQPVLRPLGWN